jgi:hypothetical protein
VEGLAIFGKILTGFGRFRQKYWRLWTIFNKKIWRLFLNKLDWGAKSGTDVMIFETFSPKKSAKKIGVFDSKQS